MENLSLDRTTRTAVERMEHLHLCVTDLERSIDFYRRVFGFEVRYDGIGPNGRTVHVGSDRFYIALTAGGEECETPGSGRVCHLGFVSREDLAAFSGRLERSGVEVTCTSDRKEGWALYFEDPEGLEIEVVGYRPGYAYA